MLSMPTDLQPLNLFIDVKCVSIRKIFLRGIIMFKSNEYFDGKVKSIAFQGKDKPATVGVMAAGEYVFNTAEKEKMTVISGELGIQLKGETEVITYTAGQSFEVAENSEFNVNVTADCAYLCEYG